MVSGDDPPTGPRRSRRDREPLRNIRVPDDLWHAAQKAVEVRDDQSLSQVIRTFLARYVRETERRQTRGDLPKGPTE